MYLCPSWCNHIILHRYNLFFVMEDYICHRCGFIAKLLHMFIIIPSLMWSTISARERYCFTLTLNDQIAGIFSLWNITSFELQRNNLIGLCATMCDCLCEQLSTITYWYKKRLLFAIARYLLLNIYIFFPGTSTVEVIPVVDLTPNFTLKIKN